MEILIQVRSLTFRHALTDLTRPFFAECHLKKVQIELEVP